VLLRPGGAVTEKEAWLAKLQGLSTWGEFFIEEGQLQWFYQLETVKEEPHDALFWVCCVVKDEIDRVLPGLTFSETWSDDDSIGFTVEVTTASTSGLALNLATWTLQEKVDLDAFSAWWTIIRQDEPALFPSKLNAQDWEEQFRLWQTSREGAS
jgi:hypothetical protein